MIKIIENRECIIYIFKMSELFQKVILSISKDSLYDNVKNEWLIVHKEHKAIHCICGHNVKYSCTIYNKYTRKILDVGTLCCKKYGITSVCENQLLIRSLKEYQSCSSTTENILDIDNNKLEAILISKIQKEYNHIFEKLELENEYYRIVPLNRLLTDLTDLQTNYQFSFMTNIAEIQEDIKMLEQKNDIHYQEELEEEDMSSEISLLSFETETCRESTLEPVDKIEESSSQKVEESIKNYSIPILNEQIEETQNETRYKLDKLTKLIYEHEFGVRELLLRLKYLKQNIDIVKEDMVAFTNSVKEYSSKI